MQRDIGELRRIVGKVPETDLSAENREAVNYVAETFMADIVGLPGSIQRDLEEVFAGVALAVAVGCPAGGCLTAAIADLETSRLNIRRAFEREAQRDVSADIQNGA